MCGNLQNTGSTFNLTPWPTVRKLNLPTERPTLNLNPAENNLELINKAKFIESALTTIQHSIKM
jgi:hypothetical protein